MNISLYFDMCWHRASHTRVQFTVILNMTIDEAVALYCDCLTQHTGIYSADYLSEEVSLAISPNTTLICVTGARG